MITSAAEMKNKVHYWVPHLMTTTHSTTHTWKHTLYLEFKFYLSDYALNHFPGEHEHYSI